MRDIFPFFQPDYSENNFRKEIAHYLSGVPRTDKKTSARKLRDRFEAELNKLNTAIERFLFNVQAATNDYIRENTPNDGRKMEVSLEYLDRVNYEDIKKKRSTHRIRLTLKIWNTTTKDWQEVMRPHSYLNEALLTRITIAIRFGALLTRITNTDFKVLCLDDMLISLDMSNRMQVVRRLLDASKNPYKDYQIVMLTHDRAFYEITKHQIEGRSLKADWKFWELYNDEFHDQIQPYLSTGNSHLELAEKYFRDFEFASCANHLRKECEQIIRKLLPENRCLEGSEGEPRGKLLASLIDELNRLHTEFGKDFSPFINLKLYKDILMNPLSHDNVGTSVFQHELREIMDDIIPKLLQLNSKIHCQIVRGKRCLRTFKITDKDGMTWEYKIELLEHLREFVFLDGRTEYSNPRCLVFERSNNSGKKEIYNSTEKLNDIIRKVAHKCGVIDSDVRSLTISQLTQS